MTEDIKIASVAAGTRTAQYNDPADQFWVPYVSEADKHDKALVESWKEDMDSILVFAGLFSASVTAFIIESYKRLLPDSGDVTVKILQQISQQLATISNGSQSDIPSMPSDDFQPTPSALRVNIFWFLSLGFSLTCALMATMVKQWARNYTQAINRRSAPHITARMRTYLFFGLETWRMETVVGTIPTLLHISLFLFFAGLIDFLLSIDMIVGFATTSVVAGCALIYVMATCLPIVHHACPYRTPPSNLCWSIVQIWRFIWNYGPGTDGHDLYERTFAQEQEHFATVPSLERQLRDTAALSWALEVLNEDSELQPLVEGIPGLLQADTSGTSSVMLLGTTVICKRIGKLLETCVNDTVLAPNLRRSRAIVCIDALQQLTLKMETKPWVDYFDARDAKSLEALVGDNDLTIATRTACTMAVIVVQMRTTLHEGIAPLSGQILDSLLQCVDKLEPLEIDSKISASLVLSLDVLIKMLYAITSRHSKTAIRQPPNEDAILHTLQAMIQGWPIYAQDMDLCTRNNLVRIGSKFINLGFPLVTHAYESQHIASANLQSLSPTVVNPVIGLVAQAISAACETDALMILQEDITRYLQRQPQSTVASMALKRLHKIYHPDDDVSSMGYSLYDLR